MKELLGDDTLVFNSDIVFDERILDLALDYAVGSHDSFIVVDDQKELVDEDMKINLSSSGFINRISKSLDNDRADGEYIGIMRISSRDRECYASKISELVLANDVKRHYEYALDQVVSKLQAPLKLHLVSTQGFEWTEVDTEEDLDFARSLGCCKLHSKLT